MLTVPSSAKTVSTGSSAWGEALSASINSATLRVSSWPFIAADLHSVRQTPVAAPAVPRQRPLFRISDGDDLILTLARRQRHPAEVADRAAAQRARQRRVPADPAGAGIGLVVADQRQDALIVVFVGDRHGGAE